MRHTRFQGAIVRDSSVLLIRHLARSSGNRYWVMPGGGIEPGESEVECVVREMREETGLDVRVERLLIDARNARGSFYRRQKTYLCSPVGGVASPGIEPEEEASNFEITDVRWFDLDDPQSWSAYIDDREWVLPLLRELRPALGRPDASPPRTGRLDLVHAGETQTSTPAGERLVIRPARTSDRNDARRLLASARDSRPAARLPVGAGGARDECHAAEAILDRDLIQANLWLAELDGSLVGMVAASDELESEYARLYRRSRGTGYYVHRLFVSPSARRRGVASGLVACIEQRARELRYSSVRVGAFADDPAAVAFCESRGYRRAGIVHRTSGDVLCFERSCRQIARERAREYSER